MIKWLKQTWLDKAPVAPRRAITHPAWVLAVFVLLVNDHMLKPQAALELLAGKLSDFAGLFFFPILLAAILGVTTRRGLWLSGAATAAVFATINLSSGAAALFDGFVSLLIPFATTTDPTDLLALVAIPAGLRFFGSTMSAASKPSHRIVEATAIAVGSLAAIATSEPPCDNCTGTPNESSQISILNKTNELHILRVRTLRVGVQLDCDQIAQSPSEYLPDALFGPPESWLVQSGQEIPVSREWNQWNDEGNANDGLCRASLIQSDTVPDILVFWDASLPFKNFAFDAEVPQEIPADNATVVLDADYSRAPASQMHSWRERSDCGERADLCNDEIIEPLATVPAGARYSWRSKFNDGALHHVRTRRPAGLVADVPEQCQTPDASDGLAWEDVPPSELYVIGVEQGLDGCHEVLLERSAEPTESIPLGWWVCAPFDSLAALVPTETQKKRVAMSYVRQNATFNEGGYEGIQLSVVTVENDNPVGLDTITMSAGYGLPSEVDFDPEFVPIEGCEPTETVCGQVALPVEVDVTAYGETVRPGESVSVGNVQPLDIYIVRAEYRPVIDTTCELEADSATVGLNAEGYIEAVVVRRDAGR